MRVVQPSLRWILVPFVGLAVAAWASLYLFPERTEDYFAWTIEPPLTAALLGAAYGGAVVLFGLMLREELWANARVVASAQLTFSTATLVATLLHLDKFHLDESGIPGVVAWIWLVVYLVVPPALVAVVVVHQRAPGADPPRTAPLPVALRVLLGAYGLKSAVVGLVLFVAPSDVAPHWPWAITPLTGQAVAAWLMGLGAAAIHVVVDNDLRRAWVALPALLVIGLLGLGAVARFADEVRGGWSAVFLIASLASMVGLGAWGMVLERRARP